VVLVQSIEDLNKAGPPLRQQSLLACFDQEEILLADDCWTWTYFMCCFSTEEFIEGTDYH
jgi:hypothetical protein